MAAPEGWFLDRGDPSVGIFGEEWVHEDCPIVQGPGNGETKGSDHESKQITRPDYHGMSQFSHILTCKDCGEQVVFDTEEFLGVEEVDISS